MTKFYGIKSFPAFNDQGKFIYFPAWQDKQKAGGVRITCWNKEFLTKQEAVNYAKEHFKAYPLNIT